MPCNNEIRIVIANVRGFHTNVRELTHRFILKSNADIVFVSETFLDDIVPEHYARVKGYSTWYRKDRSTQGGGAALCHKTSVSVQVVHYPIPENLEIIIFKLTNRNGGSILCCRCYRPPSQGPAVFTFLSDNLDRLLISNKCENVLVFGDLN